MTRNTTPQTSPPFTPPGQPAAETEIARWAVMAFFLAQGIVVGGWVSQIPILKERFGLDDAVLGFTFLAVSAGSAVTLLSTSFLIARVGSRRVTWVMTLLLAAALPLTSLVTSYLGLLILLTLFGVSASSMDVAMNAQAVGVESRLARPTMSIFHGVWSLGGLIGSGYASLALSHGFPTTFYLLPIAAFLAVVVFAGRSRLLPAEIDRNHDQPLVVRPSKSLLGLGILAVLSMTSEGAVANWSGVYLHDWLKTDVGFAAIGYAVFAVTETLGRLIGDRLRARFNVSTILRLSGVISALGLAIGLLGNSPLAALFGFGCVGLGLANVVPIVFGLTARVTTVPTATALAAVATMGYAGNFIGPPLIGFVARSTSLPFGIGIIVLFSTLIAVIGKPTLAEN